MLKRIRQSLRIGVARDSLTLVRVDRWRGQALSVLAEMPLTEHDIDSPERLLVAARQLMADSGCAGMAATLVLADELVRLWQVTPPQGATRMADLEAAAALRFQSLYGATLADWTMVADWNASAPFYAAALPRAMLDAFETLAREERFTFIDIAPQCLHAWNSWRRAIAPGAWFALVHGPLLTLATCDGKRLGALRSVPLAPAADLAWLHAQVEREALRLNLPAPTLVQACGQVPASWTDDGAHGQFECVRLDGARRGMATLSRGALLAQTGVAA
ncbi:MAG: hypothetical protein V4582_17390 [Pseudomonadota bacterium]